jgi:hypothetical protein
VGLVAVVAGWAVVGWVVGWAGVALAVEGAWGEVGEAYMTDTKAAAAAVVLSICRPC